MAKPKPMYRAYLKIKGDVVRYGADTFRTRRAALRDAACIIEEVKNDVSVEWRNEIETYGTVRDN